MRHRIIGCAMLAIAMLAPGLASADDERIAQQIVQRLESYKRAGHLRGFGVDLEVKEGKVLLKGAVSSERQEQIVLQTARSTPGVKDVVDAINVRSGKGESAKPAGGAAPASLTEGASAPPAGQSQKSSRRAAAMQFASQSKSKSEKDRSEAAPQRLPQSVQQNAQAAAQPYPQTGHPAQAYYAQRGPAPSARAQAVNYQRMAAASARNAQPIAPPGPTPAGAAPLSGAPQPPHPVPVHHPAAQATAGAYYDHPQLPPYAWPSYAAYPNYAALTYPKQYSPTAWPYIGPFYPYPQVPLGWRKVTLEWDDGWWQLDFWDK